jgi:hypothetical protein
LTDGYEFQRLFPFCQRALEGHRFAPHASGKLGGDPPGIVVEAVALSWPSLPVVTEAVLVYVPHDPLVVLLMMWTEVLAPPARVVGA